MSSLYRRPTVEAVTGLTRSTIYALMTRGEFPRPVCIGARAVAWCSSEVQEWIDSRRPADRGDARQDRGRGFERVEKAAA